MEIYKLITFLIVLTASFAYINTRFLKLPSAIGLMLISITFSIVLGTVYFFYPSEIQRLITGINQLDFSSIVLDVLLSFLLFAGAIHTDFPALKKQKNSIILFSFTGVLLSTFFIGSLFYAIVWAMQLQIPFIYCLLFGSFISPTDPIAVLGILTKANVPKKLETNIVGESLFNDGIAVVIFVVLGSLINHGFAEVSVLDIVIIFAQEALGGIVLGLLLGYCIYFLLKSIDDYETEVIITLAAVMGGSLLASQLHVSAPLAMVVAGLMTGTKVKNDAMSASTELYVDKFWHLIDLLLNALLFVLMGLKILSIRFEWTYLWVIIALIPLILIARYVSLFLPFFFAKKFISIQKKDLLLMTWGGLRGGLSVAMALTIKEDTIGKDLFVTATYGIVLFSILVQGLTLQKLAFKLYKKNK